MRLADWQGSEANRQLQDEVRRAVSAGTPSGVRGAVMEWLEHGLSEGRQLRPYLLLGLTGQLTAKTIDADLLRWAAAIELMHQASLIVDDETDEHDLRGKNRQALHVRYGYGIATTVSHSLISAAETQIASTSQEPRTKVALYELVTRTKTEMARGQIADVFLSAKPDDRSWVDWCLQESYLKTSALYALPFESTAILGKMEVDARRTMASCGRALGIIYQMGDDVRDLKPEPGPLALSLPLAVVLDEGSDDRAFLGELLASRRLGKEDVPRLEQVLQRKRPRIFEVTRSFIDVHAAAAEGLPGGAPGRAEVAELIGFVRSLVDGATK